jgi:hypothetical protein
MQREFQQARQAATQVAPKTRHRREQSQRRQEPREVGAAQAGFPRMGGSDGGIRRHQSSTAWQQGGVTKQVVEYVQQSLPTPRLRWVASWKKQNSKASTKNWRETINTTDFAQWFAIQPSQTQALADSPRSGRDQDVGHVQQRENETRREYQARARSTSRCCRDDSTWPDTAAQNTWTTCPQKNFGTTKPRNVSVNSRNAATKLNIQKRKIDHGYSKLRHRCIAKSDPRCTRYAGTRPAHHRSR